MRIIRFTAGDKQYIYPEHQKEGFAAQFAFPFAKKMLHGTGLDIGYSQPEWKLPGATGVEPTINPEFHALNLPKNDLDPAGKWDFIFSSHCLEHVPYNWAKVLLYWKDCLRKGGTIFLYLPGPSQHYWKNWHNQKHVHNFMPEQLKEFFEQTGWLHIIVTGEDLNSSFYAVAQK